MLMPSGFDHSLGNEIGCLGFLAGLEFLYTHPPGPPRRRKRVMRQICDRSGCNFLVVVGRPWKEKQQSSDATMNDNTVTSKRNLMSVS